MKSFVFIAIILLQTISFSMQGFCDGTYFIINKENGDVFDIEGASKDCGANLIIYEKNGGKNQQFIVENVYGDYYTLKNVNSKLYLSIENKKIGSALEQVEIKGCATAFQLFKIFEGCAGYYFIQNKASGLFVNGDTCARSQYGNRLAVQTPKYGLDDIDDILYCFTPVC